MRAHVLQDAPFEGPGSIGDWLEARRAVVRVSHLFAGDPLPTAEAFDLLIALGGVTRPPVVVPVLMRELHSY